MTSKEILPPSRTAQDFHHDPNYVRVFDAFGREHFVTKEQWRTRSLPVALRKSWGNAEQLYGVIAMALRDGFFADVIEAAAHLHKIDPVPSRGTTVYGIVLMKTGKLDQAEMVLRSYADVHPEDGTVLTNLAKVYSERGELEKSEATLWHGLEVDPNQENGLAWHLAIHREREGERAGDRELERVAALQGSWRAQLWQARSALKSRDLFRALSLYRKSLNNAGRPVPTDLLVQMSGDLGNQGHLAEAVELTEVEFNSKAHGLLVGNNLIKAHVQLGQIESAAKVLAQLYELQRPDWKDQLSFWDTTIAKARIAARPLDTTTPITSTILCIEGPVWLKSQSQAAALFPRNSTPETLISVLGSSATIIGASDQIRAQLTSEPGRLSRALPLFLAEQLYFRAGVSVQTLIPWAQTEPGAFIVSGVALPDSDAAKYARMAGPQSQYVVVIHLVTPAEGSAEPWNLELRVVRTSDGARVGNISGSFQLAHIENFLSKLVAQLVDVLARSSNTPIDVPSLYQVPEGQLSDYLVRLEQLLATRCAGLEAGKPGSLSGEREMIDGMLDLCLRFPSNVVIRLILAQTLLAMKSLRPNVVESFKNKIDLFRAQNLEPKSANEVVLALFDKAFS